VSAFCCIVTAFLMKVPVHHRYVSGQYLANVLARSQQKRLRHRFQSVIVGIEHFGFTGATRDRGSHALGWVICLSGALTKNTQANT
jgi:hypothetical protein